MQSLLLKLQADVAARKQPRTEIWPAVRGGVLGVLLFAFAFQLGAASTDSEAGWAAEWQQRFVAGDARLQTLEGEIDLQKMQIERLERIHGYSAKYGIGADLAASIEEIALAERIDPAVAFELVRVESEFNPRAVSPVGAIGFTQLMPETARRLSPGISRGQIFDRETNLRLGFRFLRILIDKYRGDLHLALLAYNRGPTRVDSLLEAGVNPDNGYSRRVLGRRR
ncbi:MAG TPA: lytic transglycosylase domain-containing protein [Longimicrobiaceae bacterium]|nr:lytic transglycosylase domain-containing protein [Longimicrobiaceae bacterium]